MYWNMCCGVLCLGYLVSWIVTLDVLKYASAIRFVNGWGSWIVTLDVLKWRRKERCYRRCNSWIVTLDVLK